MLAKLVLAAAIAAVVVPSVADACLNEVEWTTNDYIRVVKKAEQHLEAGRYLAAKKALGRMRFPTAALRERAADVKAVVALRTSDKKALPGATKRFAARSEQLPKDVRFKAWLAEALLATGKRDEARVILVELKERDLMPDAYAYLALAKLSSGAERYELWKACRTRAKNKQMCELPAAVKTRASTNATARR